MNVVGLVEISSLDMQVPRTHPTYSMGNLLQFPLACDLSPLIAPSEQAQESAREDSSKDRHTLLILPLAYSFIQQMFICLA